MIAALGQLAAIITQPGPSAGSSDAGHQALSAVSFSQAGQVGVAALVLLGSAALMNLIARRVRRNAPSMRESLHYKVQQSLAQSMASEAAAWIVAHPPAADTQPLADRLRQFWDVDASSREASSPTDGPIASPHAEQAA
jgi:type IV secretory pathway TrbL component